MDDWNGDVQIQTLSVEKALIPLITQVRIIVNNGIKTSLDGKSKKQLSIALPNLELAVCKLTDIGHETGSTDSDIRDEMSTACSTTSKACNKMVELLATGYNLNLVMLADAARLLLSAVTRILILADCIAVKRLVVSIEKVDSRLTELENVSNFTDFVHLFSQFGGDMVELAFISGERQNDLKDELQRAEVCAARATLEKSTMMLLTTCKTCLRHPDSELSNSNRKSVFQCMRESMKLLRATVENDMSGHLHDNHSIGLDFLELETHLDDALRLKSFASIEFLFEYLDNVTIDMDNIINVEHISSLKKRFLKSSVKKTKDLARQLRQCIVGENIVEDEHNLSILLSSIYKSVNQLKEELMTATGEQVVQLVKDQRYKESLLNLKQAALSAEEDKINAIVQDLEGECSNVRDVSKLVKNICISKPCILTAIRIEQNIGNLLPQLRDASKMLACHTLSKITQENLEVFIDVFQTQINELTTLLVKITEAEVNGGQFSENATQNPPPEIYLC